MGPILRGRGTRVRTWFRGRVEGRVAVERWDWFGPWWLVCGSRGWYECVDRLEMEQEMIRDGKRMEGVVMDEGRVERSWEEGRERVERSWEEEGE